MIVEAADSSSKSPRPPADGRSLRRALARASLSAMPRSVSAARVSLSAALLRANAATALAVARNQQCNRAAQTDPEPSQAADFRARLLKLTSCERPAGIDELTLATVGIGRRIVDPVDGGLEAFAAEQVRVRAAGPLPVLGQARCASVRIRIDWRETSSASRNGRHCRSSASCATSTVASSPSPSALEEPRREERIDDGVLRLVQRSRRTRRCVGSPSRSIVASFSSTGSASSRRPPRSRSSITRSARLCSAPTTPPTAS